MLWSVYLGHSFKHFTLHSKKCIIFLRDRYAKLYDRVALQKKNVKLTEQSYIFLTSKLKRKKWGKFSLSASLLVNNWRASNQNSQSLFTNCGNSDTNFKFIYGSFFIYLFIFLFIIMYNEYILIDMIRVERVNIWVKFPLITYRIKYIYIFLIFHKRIIFLIRISDQIHIKISSNNENRKIWFYSPRLSRSKFSNPRSGKTSPPRTPDINHHPHLSTGWIFQLPLSRGVVCKISAKNRKVRTTWLLTVDGQARGAPKDSWVDSSLGCAFCIRIWGQLDFYFR